MRRILLKAAIIAGALALPGVAHAANAVVTTDLNFRTGPGSNYRDVGTIPRGYPITVIECLSGRNWCRINWNGRSGWVSQSYIAYGQTRTRYYKPRYVQPRYVNPGPTIGFSFSFGDHDPWDRHHHRHHRRHRHHDGRHH